MQKTKQKRGIMRRAGDFVVMASGWPLASQGAKEIYRSWQRIAERDRPIIQDDTFEKACRRHNVSPVRLAEVMRDLRTAKRTYMVCAGVCIYIAALASVMLYVEGFSMARANMLIGGIGASSVCFAYIFKHSFRLWQCEIKRLDGIREFLQAGGTGRMVRW